MGAGEGQDKWSGYFYLDQGAYPPQQPSYGYATQAYPRPEQPFRQEEPVMPLTQYYPPEYNPKYNQQDLPRSGGFLKEFLDYICCCSVLNCCDCCSCNMSGYEVLCYDCRSCWCCDPSIICPSTCFD